MAKAISQFFVDLGYPLRNIRWSWGARSGGSLLLRTWEDEYVYKERKLIVLDRPELYRPSESFGLDERLVQLKALWGGDIAGYTVIATVKDKDVRPREILGYRDDAVFALNRLRLQSDGTIVADVGDRVSVSTLVEHAKTHRTIRGQGVFPVDDAQRTGLSTDSYKEKIPAIRAWLIEVCRVRSTVTYSDVMNRFALTFYPLRNAMSRLGHDCKDAGEPVITALIVDKETHRCSEGLFDEFNIDDDKLERERCYAHWARKEVGVVSVLAAVAAVEAPIAPPLKPTLSTDDFEQRAARFNQVQTRPEQGQFRDAVFRACGGQCVISGCDVPEALEAAHLRGRDWRQGHNSATDGILLRRDLHTLYDRELLRISDAGQVELSEEVLTYYREFNGAMVPLTNVQTAT
ncbi:HNH endonuclease [Janthinobacterium lividum]|uniref:HNH endonuclease n=1 Tax=Janthinobacterium lividum TaxID=29581 RepID=UPI0008DB1960|nr:HNH endonuclease signature motif containing protein [Janthinobacterium lividum]